MKIFISTLILSITIFLHFIELNASGINQAGTPEPPGPSGSLGTHPCSPEPQPSYKKPNKKSNKPHRIISFANKEFGVWNHAGGKPREVRLISARNIIPDEEYRRKHSIENRYVEIDGVRFVMFVQSGLVLGAQFAPKGPVANGPKSRDPRTNQFPNHPTRTFMYGGRIVGVWEDVAGRPRAVSFVTGNIIPNDVDHKRTLIRTQMVHQDGVFFLVHSVLPSGNIVGVELAPAWNPPY